MQQSTVLRACQGLDSRHGQLMSPRLSAADRCRASAAVQPAARKARQLPLARQRSTIQCKALEEDLIGGYTPADYITFSDDEDKQCVHNIEVVVDAPTDVCFSMWIDWTKLIEFLDLVGQIGLDNDNEDMALFQCFYRWRKLPLMEINFLLQRMQVVPNKGIVFQSVHGMPVLGKVALWEQPDGQTKVQLYFAHPIPNLLVQMQIGPFGIETDMLRILNENMAVYKQKVEAMVPPDWPQQKQLVAARVQKEQQQQEEQRQLRKQQKQQEAQQQQQQQQQPVEQVQQAAALPPEQQQEQEQQAQAAPPPAAAPAAAAAAPAGRKQRTSRKTASVIVFDEAATGNKPRSRSSTGRETVSVAAGPSSSSSSTGTGKRRSKTATAASTPADDSNGTGAQEEQQQNNSSGSGGSGRPARRSSRRTASAREQ